MIGITSPPLLLNVISYKFLLPYFLLLQLRCKCKVVVCPLHLVDQENSLEVKEALSDFYTLQQSCWQFCLLQFHYFFCITGKNEL